MVGQRLGMLSQRRSCIIYPVIKKGGPQSGAGILQHLRVRACFGWTGSEIPDTFSNIAKNRHVLHRDLPMCPKS